MKIIALTDGNRMETAKEAAQILKKGGIVVYPTDTLYGIGVNAFDEEALARLRKLKARETKKPISVMVPTVKHIGVYGQMTEDAKAMAERYLPGALTIVLEASPDAPRDVTLHEGIGIRVPEDAFCHALAAAFGGPITATSANRNGMSTPIHVRGIIEHFEKDIEHISLIIDGGERAGGTPSTVVSFIHGHPPKILREGKLSRTDLGL